MQIQHINFSLKHPRNDATIAIATGMYDAWNFSAPVKSPRPFQEFQRRAVIDQLTNVLCHENTLLLAGTGTGKTFMLLITCDILFMHGYLEHHTTYHKRMIIPFPMVYLVNASSVDQIKDVVKLYTHLHKRCFVMNYEQLRVKQSLGSIMMAWKKCETLNDVNPLLWPLVDDDKDALYVPEWNTLLAPIIMIEDEVQKLKNDGALQTKAMQSFSITCTNNIIFQASATPFVRPSESKSVVLSIKPQYNLDSCPDDVVDMTSGTTTGVVTASNIDDWLNNKICTRSKTTEYSPAAMERLTQHLDARCNVVRVHDVKFSHKSMNKHVLISFQSEAERKEYFDAFIEYCLDLAKVDKSAPGGMAAILVARGKFKQKAEWLRRYHIAKIVHDKVVEGRNVLAAFCYKNTLNAVYEILIKDYNYTPDKISQIKGGQSRKTRWDNINAFQDETSNIMLAMLQAGGTGLSLHHYAERNKRQRFVVMPPVWSIIEMLQMLGRAHRINSASTTHQWILWYKGTIEEEIYQRLSDKSMSMRELMNRNEQWSQWFTDQKYVKSVVKVDDINEVIGDDDDTDDEDDAESKHDTWNTDSKLVAESVEQE